MIRLDVAMFNAILRESEEDMPSDPISDPISDSRVLPILAGKLSFGAGAQLKNAVSMHMMLFILQQLLLETFFLSITFLVDTIALMGITWEILD